MLISNEWLKEYVTIDDSVSNLQNVLRAQVLKWMI